MGGGMAAGGYMATEFNPTFNGGMMWAGFGGPGYSSRPEISDCIYYADWGTPWQGGGWGESKALPTEKTSKQ
jgi:hypothetical protein